ncbi:MAG TPA: calcium/sodium antiporter [Candidatus Thermoplasmatota archaeon]|nr:calcium/sodium antiporter [Candidatus Thermoplasmatota archaeon]
MPPLAILALGLACLLAGAEGLVRGAARLARAAGISPLVVGLVIVSIGTSAPEIAVTVGAARTGASDLAVGNVVGSNIFNVLFILGLSALVVPLVVQRRLVRVDIPIMVAASLLLAILALDQRIGLFDAVLMLALAAGYILLNLRLGRREAQAADAADPQPPVRGRLWRSALLALAGLALLVLGARLAVDGASDLARGFGVSELVIGLTIVAAGTSLPEVATSVLAAARGERDIAVGNVVGSNVLNICSSSASPASPPPPASSSPPACSRSTFP